MGLKSVNPSPPCPTPHYWSKISPHLRPTTFVGWEKLAWGEMGRGGAKLTSLLSPFLSNLGGKNMVGQGGIYFLYFPFLHTNSS